MSIIRRGNGIRNKWNSIWDQCWLVLPTAIWGTKMDIFLTLLQLGFWINITSGNYKPFMKLEGCSRNHFSAFSALSTGKQKQGPVLPSSQPFFRDLLLLLVNLHTVWGTGKSFQKTPQRTHTVSIQFCKQLTYCFKCISAYSPLSY